MPPPLPQYARGRAALLLQAIHVTQRGAASSYDVMSAALPARAAVWQTPRGAPRLLARGSPAVQQGKPTLAAIAALDARLAASAGAVPRTETERVVLRLLVAALTRRDGQEPLRKFELFAVLHALDRAQAAAAAWRAAALAAGVTTAPGVPHEPLSWHADAGSDMTVASLHTALRQRAVEGIAGRDRY